MVPPDAAALQEAIAALARQASVEVTWRDSAALGACRSLLAPGTEIFVSFLPRQAWRQTVQTCAAIREAGFEPVPHIPVRQLADIEALQRIAVDLFVQAQVRRVLLIAGDTAVPVGPFRATLDALQTRVLAQHGILNIVVAGHPEGHPKLTRAELRRAEREKVAFASREGLELTFLTQFLFDAAPFLAWARELRAAGVQSRLVVGLAGPAALATLVRYAMLCGVGPSMRALTSSPASFAKLVGDRGPEKIVRAVAAAGLDAEIENFGMHLFSFGGLKRTCQWICAVADGRFALDDEAGFTVLSD